MPRHPAELAAPSEMALPSFTRHLAVLEDAGLVRSRKRGRVRSYALAPSALEWAESWMAEQRSSWERRLDRLDDHLERMKGERP